MDLVMGDLVAYRSAKGVDWRACYVMGAGKYKAIWDIGDNKIRRCPYSKLDFPDAEILRYGRTDYLEIDA